MNTKVTWFRLLAIAVAVSMPGIASAANNIFDDAACPLPDAIVQDGFNANDIRDGIHDITGDPTDLPSDWDEFNDNMMVTLSEVRDEIPFYATMDLIAKVASDVDRDNQAAVCACLLANMKRAALDTPILQDGVQEPTYWADKLFAAIIIAGDDLTTGWNDADDIGDAFLFQLSPETNYCNLGQFLSEGGDADGDGDTNLEEWQAAVDAATFLVTPFIDVVADFVNNAAPSTQVIVNISGPGELLWGGEYGVFTADTLIPPEDMVTVDDTSYDWAVTGPAAFVGSDTGLSVTLNATGPGTVTLTAEGNNSGESGDVTFQSRIPKWFELCDIDELILIQGAGVAAALGCTLGFTPDFNDLDLDALAGDGGVPDVFQMLLGAYTACTDATAEAEWDFNVTKVEDFFLDIAAVRDYLISASITVDASPNSASMTVGGSTLTITATTKDIDGVTIPETYTFVSDSALVASVGLTTGVVTAVGEGSTEINVKGDTTMITTEVDITVDDPATPNVFISGDGDVNVGETIQLTADTVSSTPAQDTETHTWMSSNNLVATVSSTGVVTGVATGSVTITATGAVSAAVGMKGVTVKAGTACDDANAKDDDTTVPTAGAVVQAATVAGAYTISLAGGADTVKDEATAGGIAGGSTGTDALIGGISALTPFLGGLDILLGEFQGFESASEFLAMSVGVTSEMEAVVQSVLNAGAILVAEFGLPSGQTLTNSINGGAPGGALGASIPNFVAAMGGVKANIDGLEAFVGGNLTVAGFDDLDVMQGIVNAALAVVSGPPTFAVPNGNIIGSAFTKVDGIEPLDPDSVYAPGVNPQDLTNLQISDSVLNAEGNAFDFVNIAAGLDILTSLGSPFLPAAGALGLGILAGGLAFAAAMRLRRRNA